MNYFFFIFFFFFSDEEVCSENIASFLFLFLFFSLVFAKRRNFYIVNSEAVGPAKLVLDRSHLCGLVAKKELKS